MPKYVDIEDPIKLKGITFIDENHDVLIPLSDLRKVLQMLPAADVVPRSEVEKIFAELDSFIELRLTNNQDRLIYAELKEKYTKGGEVE